MRNMIAMAILAFSTFTASAASVDSCIRKVESQCDYSSYSELSRIYSSGSCKMLSDRVALIGAWGDTVTSIELPSCQTTKYDFRSGTVIDNVVFEDRLFMVLGSHRVAFVGRNNEVYELLTSKGTSYKQVDGIKSIDGNLVLTQNGGGDIKLSAESVNSRIKSDRTTIQLTGIRY